MESALSDSDQSVPKIGELTLNRAATLSWRGKRSRLWAAFAVGVVVLSVISWQVARWISDGRAERVLSREWDRASVLAATVDARIGMLLVRTRSVPKVLAQESQIVAALTRQGAGVALNTLPLEAFRARLAAQESLLQLELRLEAMVREFNVDQIWVVNAAGDCIASGGFTREGRATGVNYADRDYFKLAMLGHVGRQTAVGRTTDTLSIYYAAPVIEGGESLGVVVVKIEAKHLLPLLPERGVFVTDELGVVIAAGEMGAQLKTLPGAKAATLDAEALTSRYKRSVLSPLPLTPVPAPFGVLPGVNSPSGVVRVAGDPDLYVLASSYSQADFLQVWVLRDLSEVERLRAEGVGFFGLILVAGVSLLAALVLLIAYYQRNAQFQREIERANNDLLILNEELRVQARFDDLTRCANRAYFLSELENELRRTQRSGRPCSLAVLDLDHFKFINDTFGHAAGDAVLKSFALWAKSCLRSTDVLGRLGGEEFAVLMPETGRAGALELAERLRAHIEGQMCDTRAGQIPVTVSLGVAEWRGAADSLEDFLARADAAMYVAKRGGRNRIATELDPD